jgi:hypothetical protein
MHVMDGLGKHVEALAVMAKTLTRGYYKQIRGAPDSKKGIVREWVGLAKGDRIEVESFNNMLARPFEDREVELGD